MIVSINCRTLKKNNKIKAYLNIILFSRLYIIYKIILYCEKIISRVIKINHK